MGMVIWKRVTIPFSKDVHMPMYDYQCQACQHTWEDFFRVAERLEPESKPCPKCGKIQVKQLICNPEISHLNYRKVPEWYKDVERNIKHKLGKPVKMRTHY